MKIILSIVLFFCLTKTQAQTIIPSEDYFNHNTENNVYFKDVNHIFDKFLGTWVYEEASDYLKIIITKQVRVQDGVSTTGRIYKTRLQFYDLVNVEYQYKHNGVEIYHVLSPYVLVNGKILYSEIFGKIIIDSNQLSLNYNEPSTTSCFRNREGSLNLKYLNETIPRLMWNRTDSKIQNPSSFCDNGTFDESMYQIPANIILIKQ